MNYPSDYNMYSKISFLLPAYEAKIIEELFEENVKLRFYVKNEQIDALKKELTDITNGRIQLEIKKVLWADFAK